MNALIIFILAFPSLEKTSWLLYCDSIFVLYFTIEAIIKIRKLKTRGYFEKGWNRFDFLIVIVSFPLLFENFITFSSENFHIITIFRLFRLLRVVRFFRFVPNLAHILAGLAALTVALVQAFSLKYTVTPRRKLRFELTLIYWHFVDFLWLYLLTFFVIQS